MVDEHGYVVMQAWITSFPEVPPEQRVRQITQEDLQRLPDLLRDSLKKESKYRFAVRPRRISGTPYAFRAGERVRRDHPAVEACLGAFGPMDAIDEIVYGAPGS
jgi:hypothetical protein